MVYRNVYLDLVYLFWTENFFFGEDPYCLYDEMELKKWNKMMVFLTMYKVTDRHLRQDFSNMK
jgi:hypothetical protein